MTQNTGKLLPLVAKLKLCSSRNTRLTEKSLLASWNCFKGINPEHGDEITPAVIAGLVLYDEELSAELLDEAERSQLVALATTAWERYQQITHPPNKLGNAIAASLKEIK